MSIIILISGSVYEAETVDLNVAEVTDRIRKDEGKSDRQRIFCRFIDLG